MNIPRKMQVAVLAASIAAICSWANAQDTATYQDSTASSALAFDVHDTRNFEADVDLIVKGPEDFYLRESFGAGEAIEIIPAVMAAGYLPDGSYRYELQVMGLPGVTSERNETAAPEAVNEGFGSFIIEDGSGTFSIEGGQVVSSNVKETPYEGSDWGARKATSADDDALEWNAQEQTLSGDVTIYNSLCVGSDCAANESFGADTIRLKENNLRIHFDDTSNSGSFPNNDWRLTANDQANGGANKFSLDDVTGGRTPFTVEAGAPSHSLYVDDGGRIGLGTSAPVVEAHIVDGDSPTVRLQQDGSSGFAAQTWDVAGNETNFFVRDATNGSTLPFRIRPGAPSNSIFIKENGDVGMGTASPEGVSHIKRTGSVLSYIESSDNGAVQLRFRTDSTNRRFLAVNSDNQAESQVVFGDGLIQFLGATASDNLMEVDATSLRVNGAIVSNGTTLNVPDYVFQDDYPLMSLQELKNFIEKNSHLPNVPSAREVNESGLNHTEFQLRLLEKIEELTLYTIQQQEIIEQQGKAIAELEKRLDELN